MSFFAALGYRFALPGTATADGGVLLASAMASHQLLRRRFKQHAHLERRVFDPQLYLATLDAGAAPGMCAKLASYPWFGVPQVPPYSSGRQRLKGWRAEMEARITSVWPRRLMTDAAQMSAALAECIDMQQRLGCEAIILPGPLTADPVSSYATELNWLDAGLAAVQATGADLPIYATVAISDLCLAYVDPTNNSLLDAIVDSVSARGVDGVYIVLEQANEPMDGRLCSNSRTLRAVLELVHAFARDGGLAVGVNFVGPFGLVCYAAGAQWWASAWYKSLVRLRTSDPPAGGRAYPNYWSGPSCLEFNLESDFDSVVRAGMLSDISDHTDAAAGLLSAASAGVLTSSVPDWGYRPSNVTSARAHYYESQLAAQNQIEALPEANRPASVLGWLIEADRVTGVARQFLPTNPKTRLGHPAAWVRAVSDYKRDHDL